MTLGRKLPDRQICEQARLSRDPRFDGLFFVAVTSTGIYCRPVCPVRSPKPKNIRYFPTAAAAEAAGFRPCLRCRPELSPPAARRGDAIVERALKLIEQGFLTDESLEALAVRVGVGERQLRRLFIERLGATPSSVHQTHRLLFAKQLLTETSLRIIDVALEAGFNSLRRFNACFKEAYGLTPSAIRRKPRRASTCDEILELRLNYRPPYDFHALLDSLRLRALPGLEEVDKISYTRVLGPPNTPGWIRLSPARSGENAIRVEFHGRRPTRILEIVSRVRRMLDLDADPRVITSALAEDPGLRTRIESRPGLRLPGGWDGFETAVRSALGQKVDAAGERQALFRLLERFGHTVELTSAPNLSRLFPEPEALVDADLDSLGVVEDKAATVRGIAQALLDDRVDFRSERTLEDFVALWSALPGVDSETAHTIALVALGHPDAFPAAESQLCTSLDGESPPPGGRVLAERTERWRPWRAYALVHLLSEPVPRR